MKGRTHHKVGSAPKFRPDAALRRWPWALLLLLASLPAVGADCGDLDVALVSGDIPGAEAQLRAMPRQRRLVCTLRAALEIESADPAQARAWVAYIAKRVDPDRGLSFYYDALFQKLRLGVEPAARARDLRVLRRGRPQLYRRLQAGDDEVEPAYRRSIGYRLAQLGHRLESGPGPDGSTPRRVQEQLAAIQLPAQSQRLAPRLQALRAQADTLVAVFSALRDHHFAAAARAAAYLSPAQRHAWRVNRALICLTLTDELAGDSATEAGGRASPVLLLGDHLLRCADSPGASRMRPLSLTARSRLQALLPASSHAAAKAAPALPGGKAPPAGANHQAALPDALDASVRLRNEAAARLDIAKRYLLKSGEPPPAMQDFRAALDYLDDHPGLTPPDKLAWVQRTWQDLRAVRLAQQRGEVDRADALRRQLPPEVQTAWELRGLACQAATARIDAATRAPDSGATGQAPTLDGFRVGYSALEGDDYRYCYQRDPTFAAAVERNAKAYFGFVMGRAYGYLGAGDYPGGKAWMKARAEDAGLPMTAPQRRYALKKQALFNSLILGLPAGRYFDADDDGYAYFDGERALVAAARTSAGGEPDAGQERYSHSPAAAGSGGGAAAPAMATEPAPSPTPLGPPASHAAQPAPPPALLPSKDPTSTVSAPVPDYAAWVGEAANRAGKGEVYLQWGRWLQEQGRYADAVAKFKLAKQRFPATATANRAEAWEAWGDTRRLQERYADAVENYAKAGNLDPAARPRLANKVAALIRDLPEKQRTQVERVRDDGRSAWLGEAIDAPSGAPGPQAGSVAPVASGGGVGADDRREIEGLEQTIASGYPLYAWAKLTWAGQTSNPPARPGTLEYTLVQGIRTLRQADPSDPLQRATAVRRMQDYFLGPLTRFGQRDKQRVTPYSRAWFITSYYLALRYGDYALWDQAVASLDRIGDYPMTADVTRLVALQRRRFAAMQALEVR